MPPLESGRGWPERPSKSQRARRRGPTLSQSSGARAAQSAALAVVALACTALVLGAGGTQPATPTVSSAASAWRGLAGSARPQVSVGQRMIVVLKAPSLAERVARAGGRASDSQERQWTAAAVASRQQVLTTLAAHGVQVRVEYNYARVINGFSAALDSEAVALLERQPEVAGVYPVRVAYPAGLSSELLARDELARGAAHRPEIMLPGFDGRGVTIAVLDTGIDRAQPFLRGRVQNGIDILGDTNFNALAATKPDDATSLERHGTEMAGLLVGGGGPQGLAGVATGASVLPIRVGGWQPDVTGGWSVYARTDQLIAGLERAVDPNQDGDAHDAARVALVAFAAPYAAFADAPDARAVQGALNLDTLVVAPAGNDGPGGPAFGSLSSPGASPAALSVGAADLRSQTEQVRVVVRVGLEVLVDRLLPLAGAVLPAQASELPIAVPEQRPQRGRPGTFVAAPPLDAFFDRHGLSIVAGRAALVQAGDDPVTAVENAARAGASAVVLYGTSIPPGGLGLDESVPVPVVAVPSDVARTALSALAHGRRPALSLGSARVVRNGTAGGVAPFSSQGLSFDWRVRPDLLGPGVALMTSEPSAAENGAPAYGTVNGSSAAAATVAGAAALLAQARPELDAYALRSVLAGYARPLGGSVLSEGTGLVDIGAAVAAEIATDPTSLAFGPAERQNWHSVQQLTIRSLSTRSLLLHVTVPQTGGAGLALAASPDRFRLRPGGKITITLKASFRGTLGTAPPAEGTIQIGNRSTLTIRVPWAIPFGRDRSPLLTGVQLSRKAFRPSDTAPAVLSFQAGGLARGAQGAEIRPVGRLDMVLTSAYGTTLGLLVRMRDLLPGRYAFGLTGRDPNGNLLPAGSYRLSLTAIPPDGSRRTRRTVSFRIK
jgi:subtilisin family serine protease